VLAGLCILGFILGQVQTIARNDGKADFVSRTIQAIEYPAASAISSVLGFTTDFWIGVRDARALRQEVERLRAIEKTAQQYEETIDRLRSNIDSLNEMLEYKPPPPFKRVVARVIGYMPQQNRATIDRGSEQGIAPHMPVLTAGGLVGVIDTVSKNTSQVMLVTSPQIRIASMVIGTTRVPGIVRGETTSRLYMDLLESEQVYTGESIVTSGFSATIPPGIRVGTIVESIDDPQFGVKRVFVLPSVHMGSVTEVYVLK
jgi:rod shape-determining protein MreC